jgi:hypothetical protein
MSGTRVKSIVRAARLKAGSPLAAPGRKSRLVRGVPRTTSGAFAGADRAAGAAVTKVARKVKDVVNSLKRKPPKRKGTLQEHGRQRKAMK